MLSLKVFLLCVVALGVVAAGAEAAKAANPVVAVETSLGTIKVELFADKAPITVKNFLDYVDAKHYDGLTFHRVIEGFMIQGGGLEPGGKERKTRPPIQNEAGNGVSNVRGTIAMARTSVPNSATSQFFINVADNTFLDRKESADGVGYAVFGRVIEGMDVADKIVRVEKKPTGSPREKPSAPAQDVVIKSVRRVDEKK